VGKPKLFVVGVMSVLLLILVIQNTEAVKITLLFWQFEMSRVILILLATATGFVGGYVVARLKSARSHGE